MADPAKRVHEIEAAAIVRARHELEVEERDREHFSKPARPGAFVDRSMVALGEQRVQGALAQLRQLEQEASTAGLALANKTATPPAPPRSPRPGASAPRSSRPASAAATAGQLPGESERQAVIRFKAQGYSAAQIVAQIESWA
ncbi:MAG: hypothetical protein JKY65_18325 [Planctomycetes bacterium]|nr:hypothetical protein [Planctomycetota bacterium]